MRALALALRWHRRALCDVTMTRALPQAQIKEEVVTKNETGECRPVRLSKDRASTWKCLENEVVHVSLPRIGIIEADLLGAYALKMT